jgi:septum site-determining protein MinC
MREVAIKGVRQGILLVLPDDQEWEQVCNELDGKLTAAQGLIAGAKAQLDVGDRAVSTEQLGALIKHLQNRFALEPAALIGTHDDLRTAAEACGISLTAAQPAMAPERAKVVSGPGAIEAPPVTPNNALYLRQTIRSGQSMRHDGTIVICGDVNPGAEVIATGDIIVFGTLRGMAHAGAAGDEDCQIIAINLRPTQIRIAGYIARSPDTAAPPLSKYPEVARVQDSEIHIIPLREMT